MDLIQCYNESDSDGGEESGVLIDAETPLQHDYFSIRDYTSCDSEEEIKQEAASCIRTIHIEGHEIELPESSFWDETDASCIETGSAADFVKTQKESFMALEKGNLKLEKEEKWTVGNRKDTRSVSTPDNPHSPRKGIINAMFESSSPFFNTMKGSHVLKKKCDFDLIPEKKLSKTSNQSSKSSISSNIGRQNSDSGATRNLFFIHAKIGPQLHQKTLKNKCPFNVEKQWCGHNQVINKINWNIRNYSHLAITASMDTTMKVWNVWSSLDTCVKTITSHDKAVKDVIWDPSGDKILSCSYDRSCVLTSVRTGAVICRLPHKGYVFCCKYHPSNPNIVITGSSNKLLSWDLRTPDNCVSKFNYKDKIGQIQDVLFDYDGETIFSCSDIVSQNSADRSIMAWDYRTGVTLSNQIYEERFTCNRLKLHPQEAHSFLAQSQGGYIAIFSTTRPYKMNKSKRFEGHHLQGRNIGFDVSSDGDCIISGSYDRKLYCYNYTTGKLIKTVSTGMDFTDVAIHPVLSSTVIASSWDGQIQLLH